MIKRKCKFCNSLFDVHEHSSRIFCSRECHIAFMPYDIRRKENAKKLWEDPDYREKQIMALRKRWEDPAYREYMSNKSRESWKNNHEKLCKLLKEGSNSNSCLKKKSDNLKKRWKDPDYREKQLVLIHKRWEDPDYIENIRIQMIKKWANSSYAENHYKTCFRYKDFELPSGRVVKLQGYEPQILEQLLQEHTEEDIIIGIKEMNKEIGRIKYMFENNEHTYYPDFYIKSTNTIIEVKSQWTFNLHKERNLAKEHACLQQGFNFEFMILSA